MFVIVVSAAALVFTVLRTWPQFIRIVVKGERAGVSLTTWMLALVNHAGWFMYGLLSPIPLFIASNLLAGLGCAATVWTLRSKKPVFAITLAAGLVSWAVFSLDSAVLLVIVNCTAIGMFLPQLVRVFRSNPEGVSITAWVMAALASATWILYGFVINNPAVVAAHFLMLPASLAILARTVFAREFDEIEEAAATA